MTIDPNFVQFFVYVLIFLPIRFFLRSDKTSHLLICVGIAGFVSIATRCSYVDHLKEIQKQEIIEELKK